MISRLVPKHKPRKFNYTPRYYDKQNNNLLYNRMSESRFAQGYVAKRKANQGKETKGDYNIDFSSYRTKRSHSKRTPGTNTFVIFVVLMMLVLVMWMITNPNFSNIFSQ
ncbi:MAG: hypothetical protein Q4F57_00580 [Weeksellaceae bacterium]|nr:hypothetical protein [Weeksellaceae bacterium]